MRKSSLTNSLISIMLIGLSTAWPGWAAPAAQMQTDVKRVALFKNGLGFFVREGKLPDAQAVKIAPFAAPVHGTFWLSYPQKVTLQEIVAREAEASADVAVANTTDFLEANVGREVAINWPATDKQPIRGKILSVTRLLEPPRPDPYAWGRARNSDPYWTPGRAVLIQTAEGIVLLDSALGNVTILDGAPKTTLARKTKTWELEAKLKEAAPGVTVEASYLAKGITWAPSYVVDITDPEQARITAKAEVINEAEMLKDVHLDLVTGFPNLAFADVISPLAGKEDIAGFMSALARRASALGSGAYAGNAMVNVQAGRANYDAVQPAMPSYGAAAAGTTIEDLFFYPVERVTLNKGEVGYFPLFSASVQYKQIYTWDIPDYVNEQDQYGNQQREQRNTQEEVWHSLKLTNQTRVPWTTAPAQTLKNGQLLGQDVLEYTAPAGRTTLKITRAMAVQAEQNEYESQRERSTVRLYGYEYDRITIEGRLRVTNRKAEPVEMEIKKALSGEVLGTAPQAQTEKLARGLARMNPLNVVTWNITLSPGEQKEITYTYQALIRR